MGSRKEYAGFWEFFPFYLSQHQNKTNQQLHFTGTSVGFILLFYTIFTQTWWLLPLAMVQGYAWAWVGHFFFEKNKPATFTYPFYSFVGDMMLFYYIGTG